MQPFFTIVVPTYNRADLIAQTLHSLMAQSYAHYEIIVVDDGSTDNTEAVVQPFVGEKLRYIKKQNAERAAARNYGASLAKGDYVNFFDSDDIALSNHLSDAVAVLKLHSDAAWFHLGYAWAYPNKQIFKEVNRFSGATLNGIMAKGNPLSCNGVFVRKDIIQQYRFNEDRALSASEDYELWCRLAARFPLYYSNPISSLVIDHETRSVRTIHGQKLIDRLLLLLEYLTQDQTVLDYFGSDFSKIKMDSYSYIALHLANQPKDKLKSITYLFKAMNTNGHLFRTKRFYATIKNILIQW
jgi:glycosyltransferase involved in cell wall biosynthesis